MRLQVRAILVSVALLLFVFAARSYAAVTLQGTVESVTTLSSGKTHVVIATSSGSTKVCLCDAQLLTREGVVPGVGEPLQVTGTMNDSLLIAESVTFNGKTVTMPCQASATQGDCADCAHHHVKFYGRPHE